MPMLSRTPVSVWSGVLRSASPSMYIRYGRRVATAASTPSVMLQSPPTTSGSSPAAWIAVTAGTSSVSCSRTASAARIPLISGTARCGRRVRSPWSVTVCPAAVSSRTRPASRTAAGAFSWPA